MKLRLNGRYIADIELSLLDLAKLLVIGKLSMQGVTVRFWHYRESSID